MSFPQLGYQYIRPIYPAERPGSGGSRGGAELAPSGTLSNVLSSMYGAPYAAAAAAQGYGAFLPYAAELPIFPQLVRGPPPGLAACSPGRSGRGRPGRTSRRGIGPGDRGGRRREGCQERRGVIAALPRECRWSGDPAASPSLRPQG